MTCCNGACSICAPWQFPSQERVEAYEAWFAAYRAWHKAEARRRMAPLPPSLQIIADRYRTVEAHE